MTKNLSFIAYTYTKNRLKLLLKAQQINLVDERFITSSYIRVKHLLL